MISVLIGLGVAIVTVDVDMVVTADVDVIVPVPAACVARGSAFQSKMLEQDWYPVPHPSAARMKNECSSVGSPQQPSRALGTMRVLARVCTQLFPVHATES